MKFGSHHYRPLIDELTIKESKINGLGLHAAEDLKAGCYLGATHIWVSSPRVGWIRTPLGGFINHSLKPNCKKIDLDQEWHLRTLIDIKKDQELTLKYTMYNPKL